MKSLYIIILFLFSTTLVPAQTYNYYYGNMHSHSDYSDGNQDKATSGLNLPWQDFNYAKSSFHMDFLGISEHNHNGVGMKLAYYSQGITQADTTTTASFVSLYGMEWGVTTNSYDGHVTIYGVDQLIGWETVAGSPNYDIFCAKSDYPSLWPIIASFPNSFATICHPSMGQFQNLDGIPYDATADNVIVGTVVRSGGAFSTTTNYGDAPPSSFFYETYYKKMLGKGYKLGPVIDHDNHNTTFGRTAHTRTVILAPSLTKANILDAYRNMRFFASDDWNVQVSFTVDANVMGSVINTFGNSAINVNVTDPDAGDNVSNIDIYYGVPGSNLDPTILTSNTGSNSLVFSHTTAVGNVFYYYAKITQADGDVIWTAPIWITRLNSALPITGLDIRGYAVDDFARIDWKTQTEFNVAGYDVERSFGGNNFHKIGYVRSQRGTTVTASSYSFTDSSAVPGTQFYRLKQIDNNGRATYSPVVAVTVAYSKVKLISVNPNPAKDWVNIRLRSAVDSKITAKIYSVEGRLTNVMNAGIVVGSNDVRINATSLQAGIYMLVIEKDNARILETKFVKE